jgi:hypothetical protein
MKTKQFYKANIKYKSNDASKKKMDFPFKGDTQSLFFA